MNSEFILQLFDLLAELIYIYENSIYKNTALTYYKAYKNKIYKQENILLEINNDLESYINRMLEYAKNSCKIEEFVEIINNIIAIDNFIDVDECITFIHEKENWMNEKLQDKVKIFVTYNTKHDYTHSANSCLSSFLHNVVYILCSNCNVKSIYVANTFDNIGIYDNPSNSREFKIACVPYGMCETEEEVHMQEADFGLLTYKMKVDRNEILDKRLIESYNHAIKDGAIIVLGSEMSGSPNVDNKLYEVFKHNSNSIIWTPPYHDIEGEGIVSKSLVFNPQNKKREIIYKANPYNYKRDKNNVYKMENIIAKNTYFVLHVKNFGRILFVICSDFFNSCMDQIISQMRVDYIIISSNSNSYNKFNEDGYSFVKSDRRLMVQCNNCSNMLNILEMIKTELKEDLNKEQIEVQRKENYMKMKRAPINVIVRDVDGANKMLYDSLEKNNFPCKSIDECLEKKLCYFMLTFEDVESEYILKEVKYVKG